MSERRRLVKAGRETFAICMAFIQPFIAGAIGLSLVVGMSMVNKREVVMPTWAEKVQAQQQNVPDGRCHEDMPCWDCKTMGNYICGRQ